jgi:hypothetical protein
MSLYGVRIHSIEDADFEWFTTDEDLAPGRYRLRHHRSSSDVFLAETIPGLILQAGPQLQQSEDLGRESLASPGIPEAERKSLESEYTQGLLERLTETSSIWQANPRWVHRLEPAWVQRCRCRLPAA